MRRSILAAALALLAGTAAAQPKPPPSECDALERRVHVSAERNLTSLGRMAAALQAGEAGRANADLLLARFGFRLTDGLLDDMRRGQCPAYEATQRSVDERLLVAFASSAPAR